MRGGVRFMEQLEADTQWLASLKLNTNWPDAAEAALIAEVKSISLTVFIIIAAIAFCGRPLPTLIQNRSGMLNITYADGRTVRSSPGPTLLEISRTNALPHAAVCGGRGRFSTCRVRIAYGIRFMDGPGPAKQELL